MAQSQGIITQGFALDPARKGEYEQLARMTAFRRELAGIHYPSDSEAGFRLAQTLFDALGRNEEIHALFEAAKTEYQ